MDLDRRKELEARRRMKFEDPIHRLLELQRAGLEAASISCTIIEPVDAGHLTRWVGALPSRDERIAWAQVPEGKCVGWSTQEERYAAVKRIVAECTGQAMIALIYNSCEGGLLIASSQIVTALRRLGDPRSEYWLLNAEGPQWIIEDSVYDRTICYLPPHGH